MHPHTDPSTTKRAKSSVAFEQSSLWKTLEANFDSLDVYSESLLKNEAESPALALTYAQLIIKYWRQAKQAGHISDSQPCYLLELDAGSGRFAVQLLAALQQGLSGQEWREFAPCYLLADRRAQRISDCWQHPALRGWIEQGNLEPVHYDARHNTHLEMQSRNLVLSKNSVANPLIVIANAVFSSMRQSLYAIDYGRCFRAGLSNEADSQCGDGLCFDWQAVTQLHDEHPLLPAYAERLDVATLLVPGQALTAIDNLRALADEHCVVISADRGFFTEQDLREQGLPVTAPESRYFLPMNGHALTWNAESQGGTVVHWQSCRDAPLVSVQQFFNGTEAILSRQSVMHTLSNEHDTTVRHLSQLAFASSDVPNLNQLMTLLKLSGYDAPLFLDCLPWIYDALAVMDSTQRRSWGEATTKVWERLYWFEEINTQLLDLGVLAMRLSAWETARQIFSFLLTQQPECADSRYYLVATLLHLGHRTEALRLAAQSLAMRADWQQMHGLHRYIVSCQTQSELDPVYDPDWSSDGELSLQPLGTHYTDEFLHQYRDPSIAVMASLPGFETLQQFDHWLDEQTAQPHKSTYAVVHRAHGLVGVVSASRHQRDAFFYFWIGADHQNQGYGQRAATLLFRMLKKTVAIEQVFTCVFEDNSRSLRALDALGFKYLTVRAREPDSECAFFVRTSDRHDATTQHRRLSRLLSEIESPLALLPLDAT